MVLPLQGPSRARRRGIVLVASAIIVVQLVAWRGTARLKAVSREAGQPVLQKRSTLLSELPSGDSDNSSDWNIPPSYLDKGKARQLDDDGQSGDDDGEYDDVQCKPMPELSTPAEQCRHVREACPPTGHIDYLQFFYCAGVDEDQIRSAPGRKKKGERDRMPSESRTAGKDSAWTGRIETLRGLALTCILIWMLFLFSWVGLVASDFFCPNLSTIAARLGLSESTAGVTFLAFGNGSPDVFSTFEAMRTEAGSLAIGELIGAASFIVSVISGSMMLIAPFRVKPFPFMRDVGFFTVAVAATMTFLFDGKLLLSECLALIGLYFLYAATVIVGTWWQSRQRQKRMQGTVTPEQGRLSPAMNAAPAHMERQASSQSSRLLSSPNRPPRSALEYDPDVDPFAARNPSQTTGRLSPSRSRDHSPSHSPGTYAQEAPSSSGGDFNNRLQRFRAGVTGRHSLLGAVEFRDVVRNLQLESSVDNVAEVYQSRDPERFLPHEHNRHRHQHSLSGLAGPPLLGNERHKRTLSVTPIQRRVSSQANAVHPSLMRAQSVAGPTGEELQAASRQNGDSGSAALNAAASSVSDPWREHEEGDGCEQPPMLPPPALPMPRESDRQDTPARKPSTLPRLQIRRPTDPEGTEDSGPSPIVDETRATLLKRWSVRSIIKTLFPSLRHLRQKSWFGLLVAFVTAPAILLLNLTLPVVDDTTDQEYMTGEKSATQEGNVRLEGEEANLNARPPELFVDDADSVEDDDNGRNIINLGSSNSGDTNPWDNGRAGEDSADNRQANLHVATALHRLPGDVSPFTEGLSPKAGAGDDPMDRLETASNGSGRSGSSDDSHFQSAKESHLFLVLSQCLLAPPFCAWAIASSAEAPHVKAKTLAAFFGGIALTTVVFLGSVRYRQAVRRGNADKYKQAIIAFGWARVALGFLVSILYIMSIVDEVVSILQTLGMILGLSDAILGLTIFAMGNSLGDLVANITIARMGHPVMAISACFAGPLLNLLLGIGISGTWLLSGSRGNLGAGEGGGIVDSLRHSHHHHKPVYQIDLSPTLSVSGVGLLIILVGTLIAVPLNGFHLDRRIGMALIVTYAVIMSTNVGVELYIMHHGSSSLS